MSLLKQFYLSLFQQLRVRKNLYQLRDTRALLPILRQPLVSAAELWPEVLPWKPRTMLDVGAYRGDVAEELSHLYHPRFVGMVEPLPQLASLLRQKVLAPEQRVFECALSRESGSAVLNVAASMPSSSLLEMSAGCELLFQRPMHTVSHIKVPLRTLDDIFAECGLSELDLLKIDVQGYELEVFAGGAKTLTRTHLIVSEVSFFEHYRGQPLFADVYDFLQKAGFELRGTFEFLYDSRGMPLQCNAIFINRATATASA